MHNKVIGCDNAVITGSFNFSRNAAMNAENVLVIHNADVADQYNHDIDQLVAQYRHSLAHAASKPKQPKH